MKHLRSKNLIQSKNNNHMEVKIQQKQAMMILHGKNMAPNINTLNNRDIEGK